MKNFALLLTLGAALGAPAAASAAGPHGIAALPTTTFSIADIGWEENPLDQLQAARERVAVKPIRQAKTTSEATGQKPAAQESSAAPARFPSTSKPQDSERDNLVEQFVAMTGSGFAAWR